VVAHVARPKGDALAAALEGAEPEEQGIETEGKFHGLVGLVGLVGGGSVAKGQSALDVGTHEAADIFGEVQVFLDDAPLGMFPEVSLNADGFHYSGPARFWFGGCAHGVE
jgi:hypothetical protein